MVTFPMMKIRNQRMTQKEEIAKHGDPKDTQIIVEKRRVEMANEAEGKIIESGTKDNSRKDTPQSLGVRNLSRLVKQRSLKESGLF